MPAYPSLIGGYDQVGISVAAINCLLRFLKVFQERASLPHGNDKRTSTSSILESQNNRCIDDAVNSKAMFDGEAKFDSLEME